MGIPKFFRWISERYPLTSQLITPTSIPTFDNLYLDMNGIIHNCSHPPSSDGDAHFRITEEQMILAIFAYIDHLFTKIKPRKVFFMAIDGVAPRAKMNQQRSRRFRTARENKMIREKAEREGQILPEEKAFDSNCITPGTPFMARLSEHLRFFINKKITEDSDWRGVKIIFSGHDVPGEGEHKIQEFIRLNKAQPGYNPNTRHCLYGLDADLIMLGLLSHDPHFCLLREEVTFGRKQKKNAGLAQQNFFLLHLSLLREYLDLEFSSISETLPFEYDLERVIDDFILLSVFVGNDFLPHLPNLHINEGAMEELWNIYKRVLPSAGGYLNENGTINLGRTQLVLNELANLELEYFEREYADMSWFKGKQKEEAKALEMAKKRGKMAMTMSQKSMFDKVQAFVLALLEMPRKEADRLEFVNTLPARDRTFIQDLADSLHLDLIWDEVDEYGQSLVVVGPGMLAVKPKRDGEEDDDADGGKKTPVSDEESTDEDDKAKDSSSDDDAEGKEAVMRVLAKYNKAKVIENLAEDAQQSYDSALREKMDDWKKMYYRDKMGFKDAIDTAECAFHYVEGLQWVMNYYYKGCSSWGWFYPYHYSPRISDMVDLPNMKFDFHLGTPFQPFQQLMGVLPAASGEHIPLAYRDLMTDPSSTILDFYPENFEEDMNGKKQEWEAIVKIPFLDEKRLLKAMGDRDHRLTAEERVRNTNSPHSKLFIYDEDQSATYPASMASFPDIARCKCRSEPYVLPSLGDGIDLISGLLDGVHLGASALAGFPSMKTLPHHAQLSHHAINVHGQDSKNVSMVITAENAFDGIKSSDLAAKMIGERTFITWPFLHEGMVTAVSDGHFRYEKGPRGIIATPHEPSQVSLWHKKAHQIESRYSKRFGIVTGHIDALLHVRPLQGLKRMDDGALTKDYGEADKEVEQAVQMAVQQVTFEDERYLERDPPSLDVEFPIGTRVIFMGEHAYGRAAQVKEIAGKSLTIQIAFFPDEVQEVGLYSQLVRTRPAERYHPNFVIARGLGVSTLAMARISSSVLVELSDHHKLNIGLSLKFDAKGLKVLGFSRKNDRGWEFSQTAYELCAKYKSAYPEVFAALEGGIDRGIAKARDIFPNDANPDQKIKEVRSWLKENGVLDLEPVSLFAEQLDGGTVKALEQLADNITSRRNIATLKKSIVKGIPRHALLKPSHAIYRLQGQTFTLGDRVVMVQDSAVGGVPLSMKGVVVGVNASSIDVLWDTPFMGGDTLSGRCSEHRGSVVPFSSCLNLTRQQFTVSARAAPQAMGQVPAFKPRLGPQPAVAGHHFRPGNQPVAPQPNGFAQNYRPRPVPQGQMHYGHAAQGIRPQRPVQARPPQAPHVQILQHALTSGRSAAGATAARGGIAGVRPVFNVPPAPAPVQNGDQQVNGKPNGHAGPPRPPARPQRMSHSSGSAHSHGDHTQSAQPAVRPPVAATRGRGNPIRGRGAPRGRGGAAPRGQARPKAPAAPANQAA